MSKSFEKFARGGKFLKLKTGTSIVGKLASDVHSLKSKVNSFGKEVIEVPIIIDGEEKIFTVGSPKVATQLAEFEEGDKIKISKVESDDGKGRWKVGPAKGSTDEDDEDEEEDEDEDEKPKKKKSSEDDEDEDESEDDEEDDEEEKPKKKKKSEDDEDEDEDDDDLDLEDDEDEEEEKPKKKKKKSKK